MNLLAAGASFGALVAVFQYGRLDAFILRTIAVPALMHLSAQANWWLPGWPDRILPICPSNPPPGHPHGPAQRRHLPGPAPARSGLEVRGEDLGQVRAADAAELVGLGAAGEPVGQEDRAGGRTP
jgi:hypothetical protein